MRLLAFFSAAILAVVMLVVACNTAVYPPGDPDPPPIRYTFKR